MDEFLERRPTADVVEGKGSASFLRSLTTFGQKSFIRRFVVIVGVYVGRLARTAAVGDKDKLVRVYVCVIAVLIHGYLAIKSNTIYSLASIKLSLCATVDRLASLQFVCSSNDKGK